jgi:hypothetical protein
MAGKAYLARHSVATASPVVKVPVKLPVSCLVGA